MGGPRRPRPRLRHRLPPAAVRVDRLLGDRRRSAPRPGGPRPAAYPVPDQRVRARRNGAGDPAPGRVGRRGARPLGLLLRPGLRARPARAPRVVRRGGTALVVDNDATRSTFGRWFSMGYPKIDPAAVERFWARHGWTATPVLTRWSFGSEADLEAVVRIEFDRDDRREDPGRAPGRWGRDRGRLRRQRLVTRLLASDQGVEHGAASSAPSTVNTKSGCACGERPAPRRTE